MGEIKSGCLTFIMIYDCPYIFLKSLVRSVCHFFNKPIKISVFPSKIFLSTLIVNPLYFTIIYFITFLLQQIKEFEKLLRLKKEEMLSVMDQFSRYRAIKEKVLKEQTMTND